MLLPDSNTELLEAIMTSCISGEIITVLFKQKIRKGYFLDWLGMQLF